MNLAAKKRPGVFLPGWLAFIAIFIGSVGLAMAQDNQANKPKVSPDEAKAAKKIEEAKTLDEKIKAATDFVKKYPQSQARSQVAGYIANQILQTKDDQQIVARSENYFALFTEPAEADYLLPNLVDSYLKLKRHKEAFAAGEKYLARHPEDVTIRLQLAVEGSNLMRTGNKEYVAPARDYAVKAIELIEANKRPANVTEEGWKEYQTRWLAQLYQSLGFINYFSANTKEAQANFEKALVINPKDVNSLVILSSMEDSQYQEIAKKHLVTDPGPARDQLLKQATEKLDKIIEMFARIVALTDGDPNAKALNAQVRENLESYYKYRNKNSLDGLQKLIDKYKNQ